MSVVLTYTAQLPVVKLGRIAGTREATQQGHRDQVRRRCRLPRDAVNGEFTRPPAGMTRSGCSVSTMLPTMNWCVPSSPAVLLTCARSRLEPPADSNHAR